MHRLIAPASTPGVGSWEPNRKSAMIPSVNSIFRRRSGVRNARANAVSTQASCARPPPAALELSILSGHTDRPAHLVVHAVSRQTADSTDNNSHRGATAYPIKLG